MQKIEFDHGSYAIPVYGSVIDILRKNVHGLKASDYGYALGGYSFQNIWLG